MGSDFNQNSDNDLPDWLRGMDNGEDDDAFDGGDMFGAGDDDAEEIPDWLRDTGSEGDSAEEEAEEEVPAWLADIRAAEDDKEGPTFMDEQPPGDDDDNEAWLESIREQHQAETENLKRQRQPEEEGEDEVVDAGDYLEEIRELKAQDEQTWDDAGEAEGDGWGAAPEEEPEDEVAAAWAADTGDLSEDDLEEVDDAPDWLSGLPSLDPAEQTEPDEEEEVQETPEWLQSKQPDELAEPAAEEFAETPEEEFKEELPEEEEEGLPHVSPLSEAPPDTGSLPPWLENLQTAGLVLPADMQEEGEEGEEEEVEAGYTEEDVSSILFEADDLPDWLGERAQEEAAEEAEEEEEPTIEAVEEGLPDDDDEEIEIEKAELPTWLQAMRPVEAVTGGAEDEEEVSARKEEKVGPLSGLSDVLPAEPHVVHFGSEAKPAPRFSLTDSQQRYAQLLMSLVQAESKSAPVEPQKVALPQKVLRWLIAGVLLVMLTIVLWFNVDIFGMPSANIPGENLAVISTVNELTTGQKVLVAFEYQPALAGEMEAASAAIIDHLLLKGVDLVLFSSQPTGPGLAESFLQRENGDNPYIQQRGYANLGYLSGGSAALLNFAGDPRRAMPQQGAAGQNLWDQPPLAGINSIQDFALVLVITDNPDVARSWVEQVQPILDPQGNGTGTPLVMAVSAQAEPLVYPYYITTPRQVSGYVSGIAGGAYYENTTTQLSVANKYWDAYNIGLVLAALVIAIGAVLNLASTSIGGSGRGRS